MARDLTITVGRLRELLSHFEQSLPVVLPGGGLQEGGWVGLGEARVRELVANKEVDALWYTEADDGEGRPAFRVVALDG